MFTREKNRDIKYIYFDLMDLDRKIIMDIEKFNNFVSIFNNTDPIFIFDYNCLEYPNITDVIDILVKKCKSFIIKCDKCKHIDIYENNIFNYIYEMHVKIDASLSLDIISKRINDNFLIIVKI